MTVNRRSVLLGGCLAAGLAGGVGLATRLSSSTETGLTERGQLLDWGAPAPHQALIALDGLSPGHPVREEALRQLASALRYYPAQGGLALGHSIFPSPATRPRGLTLMPAFPGDVLESTQTHGDALLQLGGAKAGTLQASVAQVLAGLSHWKVRWQIQGFRTDQRETAGRALARNPFHFTEGLGNPPGTQGDLRALVRDGHGEPAWAVGGSYQVVRTIRLATTLWDRDTQEEQERIMGRRRNGQWLDGTPATARADFSADPHGRTTPLDAHVRRAAPDPLNPPPLVRRSYNYEHAQGESGLIFTCFQSDLATGFEAVQKRLEGEAMSKYLLTVGGGYFFVPPAGEGWVDALLEPR
ncbi:Dyp-type peroxidase [Streptomyces erythrochromogenes]|uniref:Dyp-type peroxidase n=1 Tax=Streptomyces erythrochromogenes TaxID=285574 RepID=UPI0002ECD4CD